jgi:hypothetical protein
LCAHRIDAISSGKTFINSALAYAAKDRRIARFAGLVAGISIIAINFAIVAAAGRKTALSQALHEDLQRALSDDEVERRGLSKSLLPHVRVFYANYFEPEQHTPFYRQSSGQ